MMPAPASGVCRETDEKSVGNQLDCHYGGLLVPLERWRQAIWDQVKDACFLTKILRVQHDLAELPLPWPVFNERAKAYFRAQARRKIIRVAVDLAAD